MKAAAGSADKVTGAFLPTERERGIVHLVGRTGRKRRRSGGSAVNARSCLLLVSIGVLAAPSSASFYQDLYRGLEVLATPSGSPVSISTGGGLQNGNRFGRVRIVPNELGDGHRLEFNRVFGQDSLGRREVFDAGAMELELIGAMSATASYTRRHLPTATLQTTVSDLTYSLRGKSGAQNFELRGEIDATQLIEVNRLGFYTFQLSVNNQESALELDGVALDGNIPTTFEVGPINVQGNIFVDLIAGALASLGADTSALENVFPKSGIGTINDAIRRSLESQVLGVQAQVQDAGSQRTASALAFGDVGSFSEQGASHLPEPGSALLMGLLLSLFAVRRR
jgi:hypothetical protein